MNAATVTKLKPKSDAPQIVMLTPDMATAMLEHNQHNRPLSDSHVHRIASQIVSGKWRFNGDTIKVAKTGDVLDGQHRLWAVIESKTPIETIVVYGIEKDAFATIDTLRKPRSGADILSLAGATRHRQALASALTWLIRWQRECIEDYRAPQNRVENSDIEEAYETHQGMIRAVERASNLRRLANVSLMAFLYYVFSNRNHDVAERMMEVLENPAGVGVNDPFFRLRAYFTADHHQKKDPIVTIALAIKAANACNARKAVQVLSWKNQGKNPEAFPELTI